MKLTRLAKLCSLSSIFIAGLFTPATAQEKRREKVAEQKLEKTDFIRVAHTDTHVFLQTGITRFTRGDVTVDLIGAVHIADKSYYDQLNLAFNSYQSLLFEMVGGEGIKEHLKLEAEARAKNKPKDKQMNFISGMHSSMSQKLDLMSQKDGIDYSKDNFVHADLTIKEFNDKQKKKGESLVKFAIKNAFDSSRKAAEGKGPKPPSTLKLLRALMLGDANDLKLLIVDTLGSGDDQIASLMGKNSVIIGDRNIKCLKVMHEQIIAGNTNIGVFYGAAHFPDMEERLLKMGFKQTSHRWLNAWKLTKAKKKVKKLKKAS